MTRNNINDLVELQKNAWISQIKILKRELSQFQGDILFEYKIPRMESVVDNVFLIDGIVFVVEFKVNETEYKSYEIDQVIRYVNQLKYFHFESQNKVLVPILVSTEAKSVQNEYKCNENNIFNIIKANKNNLGKIIAEICEKYKTNDDLTNWSKSKYVPTPSILEAARQLYETHEVKNITTRSSEDSIFVETEKTIDDIIKYSKENNKKSIIFLTGVPGAGKTLVGLNIATKRSVQNDDHAVFLSGNGPLVKVLREALARDSYKRKNNTTKQEAKDKVFSFIQPIHQFRNDAIEDERETNEKIVIFDEAQRAWTQHQTEKFMKNKFGKENFGMSEPNFLISIMERQRDWAVIICLVGQGQEINNGEAGISEWFKALNEKYHNWDIYAAEDIEKVSETFKNIKINSRKELYLGITQRAVEAPILPQFIEYLLENNKEKAKKVLTEFNEEYPLFITRDLKKAKLWIKNKFIENELSNNKASEKDSEKTRIGLLAQSNALRLIPEGIFVKNDIKVEPWFLNPSDDVRSSNHLEIAATEFDIQGLEIDYSIVGWDANLRYVDGNFEHYKFKGTKWNTIREDNVTDKNYLTNSYRVLLTRARNGMVIFIPKGDDDDNTRLKNIMMEPTNI